MKKIFTLVLTLMAFNMSFAQTVNITFNVNMRQVVVDTAGVFVGGGALFGSPGTHQLTDPDGDGVYSGVVSQPANMSSHYIFMNGNCPAWNCKEDLTGKPCGDPMNWNDRFLSWGSSDTTINTCWEQCSTDTSCTTAPPPPLMHNVTFQVDMSQQMIDSTGVYLGTNWDNWSGGIALTDANNDSIYDVTLAMAVGSYEFKFINGAGWAVQEMLDPNTSDSLCTVTNFGFTNRNVNVSGDTTLAVVCWESCMSCAPAPPVTHNVTFQVDMSQQTVDSTGVYLGTNWDNWSGGIALTDANNDNIYDVTLAMNAGSYEFKYINGAGWAVQEMLDPNTSDSLCTVTNFGFTNRNVNVSGDTTLAAVCWESCMACPPPTHNVTFQVDMSQQMIDSTGVYLGTNWDNWSGGIALTDANNDSIYDVTLAMAAGSYEFKFINGAGWALQEMLDPNTSDSLCTVTNFGFTNRNVNVSGDTTLAVVCWESCMACMMAPPVTHNVTFQVDMSQQMIDSTGVYLGTNWDNWSGGIALTDANNDSIYDVTLAMAAGSYEFKYINGAGWALQEMLDPNTSDSLCTVTNFGFTNRNINVSGDTTLAVVCWESCMACMMAPPVTHNVTFQVDMSQQMIDSTGVYLGTNWDNWSGGIALTDANNDSIYDVTLAMAAGSYEFKYINGAGWALQEMLDPNTSDSLCTVTNFGFTNRNINVSGDTTLAVVCWESCMACMTAPPMGTTVNITFNVNMRQVSVDTTGVYVGGGALFGLPGTHQLTDPDGDGVYTGTVTQPADSASNYIILNGNCPGWGCKEKIGGKPCSDPNNFNDRFLSWGSNDTTVSFCWEQCTTDTMCMPPQQPVNVTFRVDMFGTNINPSGVYIGADFDNWSGGLQMMDTNGDSIYEYTTQLLPAQYEFKYINGAGWAQGESFDPMTSDSLCTITQGMFTNRILALGNADTTLALYCFDSCINCRMVSVEELYRDGSLFSIRPTIVNDNTRLLFDENELADKNIQVYDAIGRRVFNTVVQDQNFYFINASTWTSGIYFIEVRAGNRFSVQKMIKR